MALASMGKAVKENQANEADTLALYVIFVSKVGVSRHGTTDVKGRDSRSGFIFDTVFKKKKEAWLVLNVISLKYIFSSDIQIIFQSSMVPFF